LVSFFNSFNLDTIKFDENNDVFDDMLSRKNIVNKLEKISDKLDKLEK
jgi:hypothetical protein